MKNKSFKILMWVYFIAFLADLGSTIINYDLVEYLEANLLYQYGGLVAIAIANIAILIGLNHIYNKTENINLRFYIMFILVAVTATRIFVIIQNIQIFLNPPTIEYIKSLGEPILNEMKNQYRKQLMLMNFLPLVNTFVTWWFFNGDHKCMKK